MMFRILKWILRLKGVLKLENLKLSLKDRIKVRMICSVQFLGQVQNGRCQSGRSLKWSDICRDPSAEGTGRKGTFELHKTFLLCFVYSFRE